MPLLPLLGYVGGAASVTPGTHAFTIGNESDAGDDLVIGTVTIVPDDGTTAFTISSDGLSGQTIYPGGARTITVRFAPTVVGEHTATLRIPSNDPDGLTEIRLAGTAISTPAPVIAVDPPSWAAGSTATAGGSPQQTFAVSNIGTADLTVGTIVLTGSSFTAITTTASGATIPPGESRPYAVSFTPATTGAKTGSISIPSDGGATVVVDLTGTGTKTLTLTPTSWYAGAFKVSGGSAVLLAQARATGTAPVTAGTVTVTAGQGFTKGTDGISGQTLDPAESATVQVTFDPSSAGAKAATISVPSDATGTPHTSALTGTGVADIDPDPPVPPTPPPPSTPQPTSVSRFYLGRQAAPAGVSVPNSGWYNHTPASVVDNALTVAKGGASPFWGWTTNTGYDQDTTRLARWIGPPMAAQSVNTAFTAYCTAAYRADSLGSYITSAIRFGVWHAATSTITWQPIKAHTGAVDPWPTAAAALPRRLPGGTGGSWSVTLTFAANDRLIIEAGVRRCAGGPAAGVRMRWGGASTDADLADSQAAQSLAGASYIQFGIPLLVAP